MSQIIEIGMGEVAVDKAPCSFTTSGVGSCVVVCLYSAVSQMGAMAHVMLPSSRQDDPDLTNKNLYRYADVAIKVMLNHLVKEGVRQTSIIAKIAGGANMFPDVQGRSQKVGDKNVESVKEILAEYKITITGEHTGGTAGRTVSFDVGNGIVPIKSNI